MHLDEELIQRLLHDELEPARRETLSRHLAVCGECARRLEEAEREEHAVFDLLGRVDHPAPDVTAEAVMARGRRASTVWVRRAAGFVIVAALGGAAYALPGSPLPALFHRVAALITGATPEQTRPPSQPAPPAEPVTAGISIPAPARLVIQFLSDQSEGSVTVSLTDSSSVAARVIDGMAAFTTGDERLTIANAGSTARYEIDVPRRAPWIEITIAGRRVWLKEGERIATDAPFDSTGRYFFGLSD